MTAIVEANNYFNMPSILWNANTVLVPLIKMSYHVELGLAITQSTKFLDVCSGLGLLVTGVYTVACHLHVTRALNKEVAGEGAPKDVAGEGEGLAGGA